jgi:hypothetical protein
MKHDVVFKVMLLFLMSSAGHPASAQPTRDATRDKALGICEIVPMADSSGFALQLRPADYMDKFLPKDFQNRLGNNDLSQSEEIWLYDWKDSLSIKLEKPPAHGKIDISTYMYIPEDGFSGADKAEFIVSGLDKDGHGISSRLIYKIVVVPLSDWRQASTITFDASTRKYCGNNGRSWEIKSARQGG